MECAGCRSTIPNKLFLACFYCKDKYDLDCANVSEQRFFNTMTADHKRNWQCQACRCKAPKSDNSNTPVRESMEKLGESYITMRKKAPTVPGKNHIKSTTASKPTPRPQPVTSHSTDIDDQIVDDQSILGHTLNASHIPEKTAPESTEIPITLSDFCRVLDVKLELHNQTIIAQLKSIIQCEINTALSSFKSEITQKTKDLATEQKCIKDKIIELDRQIQSLESKYCKLQDALQRTQKCTSTAKTTDTIDINKTVVLHGLSEHYGESEEQVYARLIFIFQDLLNINMEGYIEESRRVGKKGQRRPLAIELSSKKLTKHLLQYRQIFKNAGLSITEYLDEHSLQTRRQLTKILQQARREGKHAVIRNNQLIVNGYVYKHSQQDPPTQNQDLDLNPATSTPRYQEANVSTEMPFNNSRNHSFRD